MFVQIGNHTFNSDYINRIGFTNEAVFVHFTGWGEMIFEGDDRAEFLAWYENVPVIVAAELLKADSVPRPVETSDRRPSGEKAGPLAHFEKRWHPGLCPCCGAPRNWGNEWFAEPTASADSRDSAEMQGV